MRQSTTSTLIVTAMMAAFIGVALASPNGNLRRKRVAFEVPSEERSSVGRTEFMLKDEHELEDLWTRAMKVMDEKGEKLMRVKFLQDVSMSFSLSLSMSMPVVPTGTHAPTPSPVTTTAPANTTPAPAANITNSPAMTTSPTSPSVISLAPVASTAPGMTSAPVSPPGMTNAPVSPPGMTPAPFTAPGMTPAPVTAPGMTSAPVTAPGMTSAPVTAPGMTSAPVTGPPQGGDCLVGTSREVYLRDLLSTITDPAILANVTSPQSMALNWITLDDPLKIDPCVYPTVQQRYGLATLYYSTGGAEWVTNDGWIGVLPECQWFGITCDDANVTVQVIELRKSML